MTAPVTPIVLLHGWGFTPAIWAPLITALEAHGIRSERIQAPPLPLREGATLAQTINTLATQLPPCAHIIGWSLGGELAQALAQTAPERVASLTLISSTPCFMQRTGWSSGQPASLLDDFDQRLAANPMALLKRFALLIRHGDESASRDRNLTDTLMQANDTDPARLGAGLTLLRHIDLRTTTSPMKMPCLVIHGTHDAVVPLAAAEWLQHRMGATLQPIRGASHALPLTHGAVLANRIIAMTEAPL